MIIVRACWCAVAVAVIAACSSAKPAPVVTVTVTPTPTRAAAAPSASASVPASPSGTPTPSASSATTFEGTCDTLLPDYSVDQALGVTSLPGTDSFVVGTPEPDIGRLAYLNCRYGVTGTGAAATPAVEIGVSLYGTAEKAAARIAATVDDYVAHGAGASDVTVKGVPAKMLTGGVGEGYDVPLLVVASGRRTVAVSIDSSVATGGKAVSDATALAALALDRTAG